MKYPDAALEPVPQRTGRRQRTAPPRPAVPVVAAHPMLTRVQLGWLVAITVLAAVLRLYRLGEWSFWVDEGHTFRDVMVPSKQFWDSNIRNYPVSYLLLRALVGLGMRTSEGWLRLPFAFFGILSVPALALFGRALVGARAALVAALLLAVSPWHIYWSQSARSYTMVLFFAMIAAGTFYEGMRRRSPGLLLGALVLTLVAGLCHPSAYILLGGLQVYGLFAFRSRTVGTQLQKWLPALILVLAAGLTVMMLPLLQHVRAAKPDFSLLHLTETLVFFVRTPLLVAAVGGALLLFDRGDPGGSGSFLLCWVMVPILVLAVLAAGVVKVTAQYAFYTLPAFCLLAAVVMVALADVGASTGFRGKLLRIIPIGIVLLDMVGHTFLYFDKYHGERPRWREAKEYIEQQPGPRKRILTTNGPTMEYYFASFNGRTESSPEVLALADFLIEQAGGGQAFMEQQVQKARADGVCLYLVLTEPELDEMDYGGYMDSYVRRLFHQVRRFPNWTGPKDMTVLVYELDDE